MIDVAVIGAGPAGLSAAVSALQRNKSVTVFGKEIQTGLLFAAEKVDNYLGLPEQSGEEMLNHFFNHAMQKGASFQEGRITQILSMGEYFTIQTADDYLEARTVILALGVDKGKELLGESEFIGRGVSYCATCDAMLYRNKVVTVVAQIPEGEEEANYLAQICRQVYYVPSYQEVGTLKEGILIHRGQPIEIIGKDIVSGLRLDSGTVACDGVFIVRANMPAKNLIFGLQTQNGVILVNRSMETNTPGVYAAGDCTGTPFQVAKAVGEGQIAALCAAAYIEKKEREKKI